MPIKNIYCLKNEKEQKFHVIQNHNRNTKSTNQIENNSKKSAKEPKICMGATRKNHNFTTKYYIFSTKYCIFSTANY
jgi:hypothetical protein